MKFFLFAATMLAAQTLGAQNPVPDTTRLEPVEVMAVRASSRTPVAQVTLRKADIAAENTGRDLPFILDRTPAIVVNADAGNGVGYTGLRIRGSDASRINVTLNGIPYNDAESQGTFFVDLPDIASSAGSIQVQRGVGTSTNGAGAFGGSINVSTNELVRTPAIELNNAAGSYGTFKNTLVLHSGLYKKYFSADARMSNIRSDGYIDRASSRLRSYMVSLAYTASRNSVRLNVITGKEKTYQAWNGIDEATLATNRRFNSAGTEKPGSPYDNETDNYQQDHYQLFFNHKFTTNLTSALAVFLTRGKGYYEQYKADVGLADLGLPDHTSGSGTINSTDLVRRLWLDNYFYGTTYTLQYRSKPTEVIFGLNLNKYDGNHYGEITWAKETGSVPADYRFYDLDATKKEASAFIKWTQSLGRGWESYIDLQGRAVDYKINGFRYNPDLKIKTSPFFFNPKAGLQYKKDHGRWWISYAHAGKEPNRDDFESSPSQQPIPEKLDDYETGFEYAKNRVSFSINAYYMNYRDQLVLNGKINDVGAYTRVNVDKSFREGVEISGAYAFNKIFQMNGNIALSRNKIKAYTQFDDDYDNGGQIANTYTNTDIAYSPSMVSSVSLNISPLKHISLLATGKYVGRQYLDNTQQRSRSLRAYYVQDLKLNVDISHGKLKNGNLFVYVNNLFSRKYEPNGYTYSYQYGGQYTTENYYFPMAPVNMMAGLNIAL